MQAASRKGLVALALVVAVAVPLVVIAVSRGGGGESAKPGGLRVERTPGLPEIVVYVEDSELNDAGTAGGAAEITLECVGFDERVVFKSREPWPFGDTDGGTLDPHVHLAMEPATIERVARCRVRGTDPPLEGRKL